MTRGHAGGRFCHGASHLCRIQCTSCSTVLCTPTLDSGLRTRQFPISLVRGLRSAARQAAVRPATQCDKFMKFMNISAEQEKQNGCASAQDARPATAHGAGTTAATVPLLHHYLHHRVQELECRAVVAPFRRPRPAASLAQPAAPRVSEGRARQTAAIKWCTLPVRTRVPDAAGSVRLRRGVSVAHLLQIAGAARIPRSRPCRLHGAALQAFRVARTVRVDAHRVA